MAETYLCPQCGKPISGNECPDCGWEPREELSKEEIQDAVFQWLDDYSGNPQKADVQEIADDLDIPVKNVSAAKKRYLDEKKAIAKRRQQEQVAAMPQAGGYSPMTHGVPDWVLEPYKMQIEALKEERKDLRERVRTLEAELRQEIQKPRQQDDRWADVETALMKKFKDDIINGRTNPAQAPKSMWEELLTGMIQSGQLGNILGEVGGLLSDLRNRGNPNYNPYEQFYAQRQQQAPQPQPQQRRRVVPPADIKRRPAPPGVQTVDDVQTFDEEEEEDPRYREVAPQGDLEQEKRVILAELIRDYPNIPPEYFELAIEPTYIEAPHETKQNKKLIIIETLKVLQDIPNLGFAVKALYNKTFSTEFAANYLIEKAPEYARILARDGFEPWLEKAKYFVSAPMYADHIRFLNEPEAREVMGQVITELRRRFGVA